MPPRCSIQRTGAGRRPTRYFSMPVATFPSQPVVLALYLLLGVQMVLNAEGSEHLVGAYSGNLLVHGGVHGSIKRYMTVVYQDANRALRVQGILREHRVSVNCT